MRYCIVQRRLSLFRRLLDRSPISKEKVYHKDIPMITGSMKRSFIFCVKSFYRMICSMLKQPLYCATSRLIVVVHASEIEGCCTNTGFLSINAKALAEKVFCERI